MCRLIDSGKFKQTWLIAMLENKYTKGHKLPINPGVSNMFYMHYFSMHMEWFYSFQECQTCFICTIFQCTWNGSTVFCS